MPGINDETQHSVETEPTKEFNIKELQKGDCVQAKAGHKTIFIISRDFNDNYYIEFINEGKRKKIGIQFAFSAGNNDIWEDKKTAGFNAGVIEQNSWKVIVGKAFFYSRNPNVQVLGKLDRTYKVVSVGKPSRKK